jgi:hypothetical protein
VTQYLEPDSVSARIGELSLSGKKLDKLILEASHRKNAWQMNIESQQAAGSVTWEEPGGNRGPGKVTAPVFAGHSQVHDNCGHSAASRSSRPDHG